MDGDSIIEMFAGLTDPTIQFVLRDLREDFVTAIEAVNEVCKLEELSPPPPLVMNAFRLCPIENTRVVILGQDPYIKAGQAQGMSFSVPLGVTVPPSLRNIYACLKGQGLIDEIPRSGDLTPWARQGVLMYNAALTTKLGKSGAHKAIWATYTDKLIASMSQRLKKLIFVLLGEDAKSKAPLIDTTKHTVLEWGHPSPMSTFNKTDNPRNFKNCNVFKRINEILTPPIEWDITKEAPKATPPKKAAPKKAAAKAAPKVPVEPPKVPAEPPRAPAETRTLINEPGVLSHPLITSGGIYIFTDGGATGNGRAKCVATWGVCVASRDAIYVRSGKCPSVDIVGVEYTASNNRGELTAFATALDIAAACDDKITIVSDSEYTINCITKWAYGWLKKPETLPTKKNIDLIMPANEKYTSIRDRVTVIHVRSHKTEPRDKSSQQWLLWKGNDLADRACTAAINCPQAVGAASATTH